MTGNTSLIDAVALEFFKPEHKINLEDYYLTEEQLTYTSLPTEALKACEEEEDRYPIVILYHNKPAGFFVLHGWNGVRAYSDNKDAILLRAYSVNHPFQGKGIAKKSLQLLPSFVKERFPEKNEIILAVNHNNRTAQQVYQKAGFQDNGIRAMRKKGEQFVYHLSLK